MFTFWNNGRSIFSLDDIVRMKVVGIGSDDDTKCLIFMKGDSKAHEITLEEYRYIAKRLEIKS